MSGMICRAAFAVLTLATGFSLASAQDSPETQPPSSDELREMPDTIPDDPSQSTEAAGDDSVTTTQSEEVAMDEPPPAGLRLEAQLLAAMAFPFGGSESGSAFGFAISYGAGWGSIPILIGLDFMSVGRSSSAESGANSALPVTRSRSDRLLNFDLWLRVQPPRWAVRPYAEGFVGAKLVRTTWSFSSGEEVMRSGGDQEWTSAGGWGVGVDFMGLFDAVASFSLTLGMRRLHGSQVELERTSVAAGELTVNKHHVSTNETIFMAGLCGRYEFAAPE